MLSALGLLVVPSLVRGRRGRPLTLLGTLFSVPSLLNVSGAVRDDWWRMVIGQELPIEQAARISDAVDGAAFMPLWSVTAMLIQVGVLLLCIGLARAGVIGWWATLVYVATFAAVMFIPVQQTLLMGFVFSALFLPLVVAGVRVMQRERIATV